jgi:hypothetical protein
MTEAGPRPGAGTARALATLAAALALFFSPALLGDGQFAYRDAGRLHLPMKRWLADELRQGRLAEWNPFLGLGVPVVAGGVDAPLHPFNLLLVALPFQPGFKLWVLLSSLVAAVGAFAWLRRLGASEVAATAAGLGFALSGHLVSSTDNLTYLTTLAAVPWVLAAVDAAAARIAPGRLLGVAAASFLCAAGGDPQAWAIALLLAPLAAALLGPPAGRRRRLARGGLAFAVGLVAAAPVILPIALFLPESSRALPFDAAESDRWNTHPLRLIELVVPHLLRGAPGQVFNEVYLAYAGTRSGATPWVLSVYGGVTVVALALLGAVRARAARLLLLAGAVAAWMAMGPYAGFGQLAARLPLLSGFRYWEKLMAWPALALAAAAALGLDALLADRGLAARSARWIGLASLAVLLGGAGATAAAAPLTEALRQPDHPAAAAMLAANLGEGLLTSGALLLALTALAHLLGRGRLPRSAPALLLLLVAADLAASSSRAYLLAPPAALEPAGPLVEHLRRQPHVPRLVTPFALDEARWPELPPFASAWRWGAHVAASCWNVPVGAGNFDSYTALLPIRLRRFQQAAAGRSMLSMVGLWSFGYLAVNGEPGAALATGLRPPFRIAAADPALPAYLLDVPHRPRAYLAQELRQVDGPGALAFALAGDRVDERTSVVEGPLPEDYRPPGGDAALGEDLPGRVAIATRSDRPALLVLNDALAPGWSATVDGAPTAIHPANYLARGVWVPAGEHRVTFSYRTPGLRLGLGLLAALLLGLLGLLALGAARRGARPAEAPSP